MTRRELKNLNIYYTMLNVILASFPPTPYKLLNSLCIMEGLQESISKFSQSIHYIRKIKRRLFCLNEKFGDNVLMIIKQDWSIKIPSRFLIFDSFNTNFKELIRTNILLSH